MRFFGHVKPLRDDNGELIGALQAPVRIKTRLGLSSQYGIDEGKRLVLTAHSGDLIGLRPERTQRELCIAVKDLYAQLVRRQALNERKGKR